MTGPQEPEPSRLVTMIMLTNGLTVTLVTEGPDAVQYEEALAKCRQRETIKGRSWSKGNRVAVPFHAVAFIQELVLDE